MHYFYPIKLVSSFHETIWGGQRLQQDGWKQLPTSDSLIGESWETENSTVVQNGPYAGQTLGDVVNELGERFLGAQAVAVFGLRFPLLAKFIDANAQLSVQVHPKDTYATEYEGGKLGKTEFWYILAAEPDASIVYGFQKESNRAEVQRAIEDVSLDQLLHEEKVQPGDVIFVPAGTVHAIGQGVLLYELQEYSDVTYRMYDYGRVGTDGQLRELHIERSLDVSDYGIAPQVKVQPVSLSDAVGYEDRCLVACRYFVTHEIHLSNAQNTVSGRTEKSCIILTSLGAQIQVCYGKDLAQHEQLTRGETMVLPADLGEYQIRGQGVFLFSYVPTEDDSAWQKWQERNRHSVLL